MGNNTFIYSKCNFSLDPEELMLNETLFHNANGYIGVRSVFEEGYPAGTPSIRGTYINGFYDLSDMKQAEKLYGLVEEKQTMLNVADTQGIRLIVENEEFNLFGGEILESSRTLDMENGVTVRHIVWRSVCGHEIELTITRMTSFSLLPLFTIEYTVCALNFSGKLQLKSTHTGNVMNYSDPNDPRVAGESTRHILPGQPELCGAGSVIVSHTAKSGLTVASAVKNVIAVPAQHEERITDNTVVDTFTLACKKGEPVTLTKYSTLCDSIRYADCRAAALDALRNAVSVPLNDWYARQRDYLANYWQNCAVNIGGDDDLSAAITYNLYQLVQSVGKDPYSNISAKGLSGEGYEGHYFWDTEMYLLPFFSLCMPDIARNLIEYRYTILGAARENARLLGHRSGALFPWRTIMGRECSGYFPSGTAQYHINGDIAYSIINYYLLTKDLDFITRCGAEIVFETARLWLDVGNYCNSQFVINDVTGPDEYTCIVNNNYYTNVLAQYNLRWAARFYSLLDERGLLAPVAEKINLCPDEISAFLRAAESMYLPYDEKLGINPQDDSFLAKKVWNFEGTPADHYPLLLHYHPLHLYRHQVCKQADTVLAHFVLEDAQNMNTMKNSFDYYEKVTTHDSSLSTCIFSIMASKLGMPDKAFHYFGESAKLDIFNTHKNTKDGIHTANMGGNYMSIVYGFGGLRVKEDGLHFAPSLPNRWECYDFRIHFEDSLITVQVDRSHCTFNLESGSGKNIVVFDHTYMLRDTVSLPLLGTGAEQ